MMQGDTIRAPLSLRDCVWYRYRVEKKTRSSNHQSQWRTVSSGVSEGLFYFVDPTGRCVVDPDGATVTPASHRRWYGDSQTPGAFHAQKDWRDLGSFGLFGKRYRYTEDVIEDGDPLYILGEFRSRGGAGASFDRNAEIRELLREWKQNSATALAEFDKNRDGEIDVHEWELARAAAGRAVDENRAAAAVAPPIDVVHHSRGSRRPFVIAARTETEMLSRFHWITVGFFTAALLAVIVVVWLIAVR